MSLVAFLAVNAFYVPVSLVLFHFDGGVKNTYATNLFAASLLLVAFLVAYAVIWRRAVRWTPSRTWGTLMSVAGVAGLVGGVLLAWQPLMGWDREVSPVFAALAGQLAFVGLTAWIWRDRMSERPDRLVADGQHPELAHIGCPSCGYNLAKLRSTTCPECGSAFTIDELFASWVDSGKSVRIVPAATTC